MGQPLGMADLATQTAGAGVDLPGAFPEAFRWMVLARTFEEKIASIYRAGKIVGGVYLGREAVQQPFGPQSGQTV